MTEGSLITDELKKLIGVPRETTTFKIEEGAIKRYAEAIDDQNPLFNDIEQAPKSKYGRLICPPGFTGWPLKGKMLGFRLTDTLLEAGAPPRVLDGGIEFEFFMPIGAGDTLAATGKILSITERETKSGSKMMFTTDETTFLTENGDVALKSRQTLINL